MIVFVSLLAHLLGDLDALLLLRGRLDDLALLVLHRATLFPLHHLALLHVLNLADLEAEESKK